jgi:YggT family protein
MFVLIELLKIVNFLLWIMTWVIIIQVVLSWLLAFNVLNTNSHAVRSIASALDRITAPFYRPIRAVLPDFGGLDFSPLIMLLIIQLLMMLVGDYMVHLETTIYS